MNTPLFINGFEKGQTENSQIGMGNLVGIDTYSKKGVARLSKKSTVITGGAFTSYPTFMDSSGGGTYTWLQLGDGSVVYTADNVTWQTTNTAFPVSGNGNGMIFFLGFMFAFTNTAIYYWKDTLGSFGSDPTNGAWVLWKSGLLSLFATPINAPHFPFLYPSSRSFYFCNGGKVGIVAQSGTTGFNPAGVAGTDYLYNDSILTLSSSTLGGITVGSYVTTQLDFLPPSNLAISAFPYGSPAQNGDLFTWDTVSANKFSPPLHIFGNQISGNVNNTGGIKQLFNRNQVLYAISGGNHAIYETNGSTYNLVEDIALMSNMRYVNGSENDYPVFFNSFPSAICVIGNKLLTGVASLTNSSTYPQAQFGVFPLGVWSIAFNDQSGVYNYGGKTTQCEYVLPIDQTTTSPAGAGNYSKITLVKPLNTGASTKQILIGFAYNTGTPVYGVSTVDLLNYIDDRTYTAIESPFFEIGTSLNPQLINTIEINLIKVLITNQTIDLYYRKNLNDNWSPVAGNGGTFSGVFTGDSTQNNYKVTNNNIGKTQFIQFRLRMASESNNPTVSPELRSVKIS